MDFENMMTTPVIYQDIPSSFMMSPMPIMPMYGAYPYYGVAPMKPVLNNDKFQKLEEKNRETNHTIRNTAIIGGIITAVLLLLGKKFKAPNINFPKLGPAIQTGWNNTKAAGTNCFNAIKNYAVKGWDALKSLFKKGKP